MKGSSMPKHCKQGAGRSCPPPFLAKQLDYNPKARPQSLAPYLATSLYLIKTLRYRYQNTEVQQSRFIICLVWLTCPIRTHQRILAQMSPFSP